MKNYVILQTGENQDLFPVTTSDGVFVDDGTKKLTKKLQELSQAITEVKEEINNGNGSSDNEMTIGSEEIIISSSDFTYIDGIYQKEITHSLNSENLHITAKKAETKEGYLVGWKIIDETKILIVSDEQIDLSVVVSALYYHTDQSAINDVIDEVAQARLGDLSLKETILKRICYEDFTADSIN